MENVIRPRGKRERAVGIDLGTRNLAILSNGIVIPHHPSLQRLRYNLRHLKYKLERQAPNSKRSAETKRILQKTQRAIERCQTDHAQKIAAILTKYYKTICLEVADEDAKDQHVIDANWPVMQDAIKRACKKRNRTYVGVKPYFTSQTCSHCGQRNKISIEVRTYSCDACGLKLDRDVNSALVIKQTGLKILNKKR